MKSCNSIMSFIFVLILFFAVGNSSAQSIYIIKLNDLQFGDVFIGYNAEVLDTDAGAAKFSFYHTHNRWRNIRITFNLPAVLTNGESNIPITFDQSHSSWSFNDQSSGRSNFDPFHQLKIKKLDPFETIFIWLGGTINTSAGLPYGLYSGTIILTVAY